MRCFKVVFSLLSLFLLLVCSACGGGGSTTPTPTPERINFSGVGDLGIYDPSLSQDPTTGRLWMSYSTINTSIYHSPSIYWAVALRLAYSDDNGINWTDAGVITAPNLETLVGPMAENHPTGSIPAGSQGIWQSETSSIIYDPSAPVNERWKLIWHQYLNANLTSFFVDHGWIAMKVAATPQDLAAAPTVKLFGGAGLLSDGSNTGSPVFSPAGGMPIIQLNTDLTQSVGGVDLAELNLCIFVEPGLFATNSAIYMTSYCADASTVPMTGKVTEYIVHFRCNIPCDMTNAASWEYLGRLLTPDDAQLATGDSFFQAPALVEKNGTVYLVVTSVDNSGSDDRYNGCRVYEFIDVNSNQLRRVSGELVEVARVEGDLGSHHGACEAYTGLDGGILLSQFGVKGMASAFQIFKSQVTFP